MKKERERGGEERIKEKATYEKLYTCIYRFQIPCDNINSYCGGKCAVGSDSECRKCIVVQYMC